MITGFTVDNFGCFANRNSISTQAAVFYDKKRDDTYKYVCTEIFKHITIKGEDQVGKTTLLKSLEVLINISSTSNYLDTIITTDYSFKSLAEDEKKLTTIELGFCLGINKYYYEIRFNKDGIQEEYLYRFNGYQNKDFLFTRENGEFCLSTTLPDLDHFIYYYKNNRDITFEEQETLDSLTIKDLEEKYPTMKTTSLLNKLYVAGGTTATEIVKWMQRGIVIIKKPEQTSDPIHAQYLEIGKKAKLLSSIRSDKFFFIRTCRYLGIFVEDFIVEDSNTDNLKLKVIYGGDQRGNQVDFFNEETDTFRNIIYFIHHIFNAWMYGKVLIWDDFNETGSDLMVKLVDYFKNHNPVPTKPQLITTERIKIKEDIKNIQNEYSYFIEKDQNLQSSIKRVRI